MNTSFLKFLVPKSFIKSVEESFKVIHRSNKMAKVKDKESETPHIDFKTGIIHGVLKQVRYSGTSAADAAVPKLVGTWSCILKPQQTKSFIKFIREYVAPYDHYDFVHYKRLQKEGSGKDFFLKGILCSTEFKKTKNDLLQYMNQYGDHEIRDLSPEYVQCIHIPSNSPPDKDIWAKWSSEYWPMSWKGDPNDQFLKQTTFNLQTERERIKALLTTLDGSIASRPIKHTKPVATIAVNPENDEIVATAFDCRTEHPLHHSVMKVIEKVADNEKIRRSQDRNNVIDEHSSYLLNGLVIYTTHEPCVMCSMALVHSRIKRIIFLQPMKNGGLETNYQIGNRDDLNWKFETWRWLDEEDINTLSEIESRCVSTGGGLHI